MIYALLGVGIEDDERNEIMAAIASHSAAAIARFVIEGKLTHVYERPAASVTFYCVWCNHPVRPDRQNGPNHQPGVANWYFTHFPDEDSCIGKPSRFENSIVNPIKQGCRVAMGREADGDGERYHRTSCKCIRRNGSNQTYCHLASRLNCLDPNSELPTIVVSTTAADQPVS